MKLYIDPGHGGRDPGATGNGLMEKDVVLDLAKRIEVKLKHYNNVRVKLSRDRDVYKSLTERTKEANAWGADLFLSLHCNAFNGKVRGYEDYVYNRLPSHAKARSYQSALHKRLSKVVGTPNRGMKQANFHVLRESSMPAILTENGFIDHPEDAKLMKQNSWREKLAEAYVKGIVEIFQLKRKNADKPSGSYQIIAGSFKHQENAAKRKQELLSRKKRAHIQRVPLHGQTMHRVVIEGFPTRQEAEREKQKLNQLGIESFIIKK